MYERIYTATLVEHQRIAGLERDLERLRIARERKAEQGRAPARTERVATALQASIMHLVPGTRTHRSATGRP